jgi:competence protein ComEA
MIVALFLLLASSFAFAEPIDINTADATTLAAGLKGVGPTKAEAIVAYRTKHGRFITVDDLVEVNGIGEKTVDKNRANMSVGATESSKDKSK